MELSIFNNVFIELVYVYVCFWVYVLVNIRYCYMLFYYFFLYYLVFLYLSLFFILRDCVLYNLNGCKLGGK